MTTTLNKGFGAPTLVLKDLEKIESFKKGHKADNVPQTLVKHFPNTEFLNTSCSPGIYVIYSPCTGKFYIGQSKNVSREVSMKRTGRRATCSFQALFPDNPQNIQCFAIYQGPGLEDEKLRLSIEIMLIQKTAGVNVNSVHTNRHTNNAKSAFVGPGFCTASLKIGSSKKYNLHYVGSVSKPGSCIYLFVNTKTERFYIGETKDFRKCKIMWSVALSAKQPPLLVSCSPAKQGLANRR
jgi:predicted GIY-YIG superfamily endonuclease